jgi:hypothetical protein
MSNEKNSPTMTDGFHLVVDALKLNGLDTIYGVAGIPITDLASLKLRAFATSAFAMSNPRATQQLFRVI